LVICQPVPFSELFRFEFSGTVIVCEWLQGKAG
jgi:hypothetical protein